MNTWKPDWKLVVIVALLCITAMAIAAMATGNTASLSDAQVKEIAGAVVMVAFIVVFLR